ncbi:MAG: glycosyltransferase family 2 protein, partial [Promethearchaeota archaeon]
EIIVVNDGSTDKTPEILKQFKGKIKVINNEKNMGIGYSRQIGVENASGEYIAFLSADDELMPTFVDVMLFHAKENDAIAYCDYYVMSENGQIISKFVVPKFADYEDFVIACYNSAKHDSMFVCYNLLGNKKYFLNYPFPKELRFGEDLYHLLLCIKNHVKFVHVPLTLFKYRIHNNMVTQQKIKEIHANNQKIFKMLNLEILK